MSRHIFFSSFLFYISATILTHGEIQCLLYAENFPSPALCVPIGPKTSSSCLTGSQIIFLPLCPPGAPVWVYISGTPAPSPPPTLSHAGQGAGAAGRDTGTGTDTHLEGSGNTGPEVRLGHTSGVVQVSRDPCLRPRS